jgi:hypothetical protein
MTRADLWLQRPSLRSKAVLPRKPIAPSSPWQNAYAERLIGTIRRECLDHVIVFGEAHLRRILGKYAYYNDSRIHRSLNKDAPFYRAIERVRVALVASRPVAPREVCGPQEDPCDVNSRYALATTTPVAPAVPRVFAFFHAGGAVNRR